MASIDKFIDEKDAPKRTGNQVTVKQREARAMAATLLQNVGKVATIKVTESDKSARGVMVALHHAIAYHTSREFAKENLNTWTIDGADDLVYAQVMKASAPEKAATS
jgi:hypothetical protein